MGVVSIRAYKEDAERWGELLSEKGVKAGDLFSEIIDANRAMKILKTLMEVENNFINSNKNSKDIEVVMYVCYILRDCIMFTEDTFNKILDCGFEEINNKLDYSLELLNYKGNIYYEDYKKLVNNFKSWERSIDNTLKEIEDIKEKLNTELPKSFVEDASMLEALSKYRKTALENKYLTTTGVLNYIEKK